MDNFVFHQDKSPNLSVSPTLRLAVWDMYGGCNKKTMLCPLCGKQELYKTDTRKWEAAHIVAKMFHTQPPTRYDLVPSCPGCNSECSNVCVLDYLVGRERYNALRLICRSIYQAYAEEYPQEFKDRFKSQAWRLLQHLFGKERYRAGGGIGCEYDVYSLAQIVQMNDLRKNMRVLMKKVEACSKAMKRCAKRPRIHRLTL